MKFFGDHLSVHVWQGSPLKQQPGHPDRGPLGTWEAVEIGGPWDRIVSLKSIAVRLQMDFYLAAWIFLRSPPWSNLPAELRTKIWKHLQYSKEAYCLARLEEGVGRMAWARVNIVFDLATGTVQCRSSNKGRSKLNLQRCPPPPTSGTRPAKKNSIIFLGCQVVLPAQDVAAYAPFLVALRGKPREIFSSKAE